MGILFFLNQKPVLFQPLHHRFVGLKHLFARIIGNFGSEFAGFVDRTDNREVFVIGATGFKVVLPETGGDMNDAGAIFGRNELARQNPERAFFLQMFEIREHRLIT